MTFFLEEADNLPKSNGLPKQDLPQQSSLPESKQNLPEQASRNLYGVGAAALALSLGLYLTRP